MTEPGGGGTAKSSRGSRVLVIDDDALVRESLRLLLADAGYLVEVAADGAAGLERLAAVRVDIILVDLMMPGMNGRQFLRTLREAPENARVPVILMTGVHGITAAPDALGASDVVEKPLRSEDLLNKVALAEYRSKQARGTLPPPRPASTPPRRHPTPTPVGDGDADGGIVMLVARDRAATQRLDALVAPHGYTVVALGRVSAQLPRMVRALRPRALVVDVLDADEIAIVEQVRAELGGASAPIVVIDHGDVDDAARALRDLLDVP